MVANDTTKEIVGQQLFHVHFILGAAEFFQWKDEAPTGDFARRGFHQGDTDFIDYVSFEDVRRTCISVDCVRNFRLKLLVGDGEQDIHSRHDLNTYL